MIVEIAGLPDDNIYKKGLLMAPVWGKDSLYWIGSNYIWDFDNTDPTTEFRELTERSLREWLKLPYKIIDHHSGVRPATLERRPFVGIHPHCASIGILNGMGTKGCSLAPFFARQLTDHLLHGDVIAPEADVNRFNKILMR